MWGKIRLQLEYFRRKANKKKDQMDLGYHKILQFHRDIKNRDNKFITLKVEHFLFLLGFEESWRLSSSVPSC